MQYDVTDIRLLSESGNYFFLEVTNIRFLTES
jgi:hypothetical protein